MLSIILAVAVFALLYIATRMFINEDESFSTMDWQRVIIIPLVVGAINYASPRLEGKTLIFAPLFFVVMIGLMLYLCHWFHEEGCAPLEVLVFIALEVLFGLTTASAAEACISLVNGNEMARILLTVVRTCISTFCTGFFIVDALMYNSRLYKEYGKTKKASNYRTWATIVTVLCALLMLCNLASIGLSSGLESWLGKFEPSVDSSAEGLSDDDGEFDYVEVYEEEPSQPVQEISQQPVEEPANWYHFYNDDVQHDGLDNDYNFGPEPDPQNTGWTVVDFDSDFHDRVSHDTALAAADMAWLDANVGTRYLGEFYESCKGDWAKTMNLTKVKFLSDRDLFNRSVSAFFAFLDSADSVEVVHMTGLKDQMYMNPFTVDEVPDIIVMETSEHEGWFLVYTFVIKGKAIPVAYRLECGYQPANVEEIMGIKPQKQPGTSGKKGDNKKKDEDDKKKKKKETPTPTPTDKPKPTPTPTDKPKPTPTPTDKPKPTPTPTDKPKPTPTETPKYNKDKTKGTKGDVVKPNDDPGPGPDTNNGEGSNKSTKEQPTNSNNESYEEYKNDAAELKETNETQAVGGDDNTPSQPAPPETTVDNNGDKGAGNGGIDEPTEKTAPATVAETDQPISDNPAEEWEGPQD